MAKESPEKNNNSLIICLLCFNNTVGHIILDRLLLYY